jgi:Colicin E5 ribonuclease domain
VFLLCSSSSRLDRLDERKIWTGLETVAKALNDNNPCLAAIALVQTRIPPLPDPLAAERMAQADELAKGAASYNPAQPRVPAGQPGAGQWMAGLGEALSALAERGLPWLAQTSARLAGPLAIATGVLFPDNATLESQGAVPGFSGLDYRFSESQLTLIQHDGQGDAQLLFHGLPDKDGIYRDSDGTVVGRAVGNSFMIDNDGAKSLISAAAQHDENGDGASPGIGHNGGPAMDGTPSDPNGQEPNQKPPLPLVSPAYTPTSNDVSTRQSGDTASDSAPVHFTIEQKISDQMEARGWTPDSIATTIANPAKTISSRDTRYNQQTGARRNDPATAYVNGDGSYVVINNMDGTVVQLSDKNDPDWKKPWEK